MIMTDLIAKKRDGSELTTEEIDFMIQGFTKGEIPDYQMSAMCMAILFRGMSYKETLDMTISMMNSGEIMDLSAIQGIKADKHSTGGVGDKTSLVLCPMVSACGLKIAKMSGRGLGHTGGTLDKLESIPGVSISLTNDQFIDAVNKYGISIMGQTANLDPADKLLYALRDVTATVPSIPLIVSSIMSKKLASGADVIVLDVKCGNGSFMKTIDDATHLAENLISIGKGAGRKCSAIISDMDQPLGYAIGNSLEVKEAIKVLNGEMGGDLLDLCLTIGSKMLVLAGYASSDTEAATKLMSTITSKSALNKLGDLIESQGGDRNVVNDVSLLPKAEYVIDVESRCNGFITHIDAEKLGLISMHLGGGRAVKTDVIDPAVGVVLNKKNGDFVEDNDVLATIHASSIDKANEAIEMVYDCYTISTECVENSPFIKKIL